MKIIKVKTIQIVLHLSEDEAIALRSICIATVKAYAKKNDAGPRTDEENIALDILGQTDDMMQAEPDVEYDYKYYENINNKD